MDEEREEQGGEHSDDGADEGEVREDEAGEDKAEQIPDPLADKRPDSDELGIPEEAEGLPGIPDDV